MSSETDRIPKPEATREPGVAAPPSGPPLPPGPYQLPQHCGADRRRAREATLAMRQRDYPLAQDNLPGNPSLGFRLPDVLSRMPPARDDVTGSKKAQLLWWTWAINGNQRAQRLVRWGGRMRERGYRGLYGPLSMTPAFAARWDDDLSFGRQRLCGVNPMQLERCTAQTRIPDDLAAAASHVLEQIGDPKVGTWAAAIDRGEAFFTAYPLCDHPFVQAAAERRKVVMAAPTCLFWSDRGTLRPLAIQLRRPGALNNPVFTPRSASSSHWWDWMLAKAHASAADGTYHEGIYHLLETHVVSEVIILAMRCELHPHHPVHQLLEPHTRGTLSINTRARGNLLKIGGAIDVAMAPGVGGVLDAARAYWCGSPQDAEATLGGRTYHWENRRLTNDLALRGLLDDERGLSEYPYRLDSLEIDVAIEKYVRGILSIWYRSDADVARDHELQAWFRRLAVIPGFPSVVCTRAELVRVVSQMLFNFGPQHAAVNNGQFDAYGYVPNSPGTVRHLLPSRHGEVTERSFWRGMPTLKVALAQVSMVRILSIPTTTTLLQTGQMPAFDRQLNRRAADVVSTFRLELQRIADRIDRRNDSTEHPYSYLAPRNISQSTDI